MSRFLDLELEDLIEWVLMTSDRACCVGMQQHPSLLAYVVSPATAEGHYHWHVPHRTYATMAADSLGQIISVHK